MMQRWLPKITKSVMDCPKFPQRYNGWEDGWGNSMSPERITEGYQYKETTNIGVIDTWN